MTRAQSCRHILYSRTPTAPAILLLCSPCLNGLFPAASSPPRYSSCRTATNLAPSLASRAASVRRHVSCHHSWPQSVYITG
eukprot:2138987-Pleurochrysis_carterae.AAC.2